MNPSEPNRSNIGSTSRSLLNRVKKDDSAAWHELVVLYSPLIVYWCQRQGLSADECEDIVQDVFRTVYRSMETFRKEKPADTFRGWLRTVTRSRVADYFRRNGAETKGTGGTEANVRMNQFAHNIVDDEETEEVDAQQKLYLRAIAMIRAEFTEQSWQAFWRTTVDEQPAQDVAEELGMRPGTVRVAKSRVLKRLREQLGDSMD